MGEWFCASCATQVQLLSPPLCVHCNLPIAAGDLCEHCRHNPSSLAGIRAATRYADPIREAIIRLKFHGWQALADSLSLYLWQIWQHEPLPVDALVPVPSDKTRLRARGYNQSTLLARGLSRHIGKPVWEEALERTRPTTRQVELTAAQRWQNVDGAFRCREHAVQGRVILLVDDICTTGATLEACAAELRAAGARAVWGMTVARTVIPPSDRANTLLPDAADIELASVLESTV